MDLDALLAGLDPDQRAAVAFPGEPLCIVAPAGSGKTRVLTRRVARRVLDGSADERHVLAITFTRRAAAELVGRLRALGLRDQPTAGTFHGVAYRLLRQRWSDQRRPAPTLVTYRPALVGEVLAGSRDRGAASAVSTEIDWARARRIGPDAYPAEARRARRRSPIPAERTAAAYAAYEQAKRERKLVDFDDLLTLLVAEVARDRPYAEALRWRFRHLFVDEFQDVNPLQHAFLMALLGERGDLCVVGDPQQAIYGWNGADASWLEDFVDCHPGATVVHLGRSHRSNPQILALAHQVLDQQAPAATRAEAPPPRWHRFPDRQSEAIGVAHLVLETRRPGGSWSAMAVLARTNAQLGPIATALRAAGVPVRLAGSLLATPTIRRELAELTRQAGPGSLTAWVDERAPDASAAIEPLLVAARDALDQDPLLDGTSFGVLVAAGGHGDGAGWRSGMPDAVTLATFHAAKGLEWPVVVVTGLERGLVPHAGARSDAARAEERRLLHVALTRAADELHLTWAGELDDLSPFLVPLADGPTDEHAPAPPPRRPRRSAVEPDPVVASLHAWRAEAARAARVPEAFVCSDDALEAVARARPSNLDELAALPEVGALAARRLGARLLAVLDGTWSPGFSRAGGGSP